MPENYGHFDENGAFVITERMTPRHWYNYIFNNEYNGFTSQVGFGQGFAQDDRGRRVELVKDRSIYIADEEGFYLATGLPVYSEVDDYKCIHDIGYSNIELKKNGIKSNVILFVPNRGAMEVISVRVENVSDKNKTIKVIPYLQTAVDGAYNPQGYETCQAYRVDGKNVICAEVPSNYGDGVDKIVYPYFVATEPISGYDTRHNAFIGCYGTKHEPKALIENGGCANTECIAEKICFALQNTVTLKPGEAKTFSYVISVALKKEDIFEPTSEWVLREFEAMRQKYKERMGKLRIETPMEDLNCLANDWLKYETDMGSRWGRVRHNGYRDIVSDTECLSSYNPELAKERIKRILTFQYSNGYAPRLFISGWICDNNFADNTVWLTFAVTAILKELGDLTFLDDEVRFNDGTSASIYEHIKRSVEYLYSFTGMNGLVKIWGGDWNDCLNKAGLEGKGVSVWLSIAFVRAAKMIAEVAEAKGYTEDAVSFRKYAEEMTEKIEKFGFEGDRYIYAISDKGTKIGSKESEEGKMTALPQLWSVMAGLNKKHSLTAMKTLEEILESPLGLKVMTPGYTKMYDFIGVPKMQGLHENGGVYLHSELWKIAVDCMLQRNQKVEEGIKKVLPGNDEYFKKYGEPYALFNSYLGPDMGYRAGTPGQSWRTASAQWFLNAIVRFVYGLSSEIDGMHLKPCLPPEWKDVKITKAFRGGVLNIRYIQKEDGGCNKIKRMEVNGKPFNSKKPLVPEKGQTLDVVVELVK